MSAEDKSWDMDSFLLPTELNFAAKSTVNMLLYYVGSVQCAWEVTISKYVIFMPMSLSRLSQNKWFKLSLEVQREILYSTARDFYLSRAHPIIQICNVQNEKEKFDRVKISPERVLLFELNPG